MRQLGICIVILTLGGCGGNVKNIQCSGVDWAAEGYQTAVAGESVREFDQYRNRCGDRLELGAMNAYVAGYGKGVAEVCTYDQGYAHGYARQSRRNTCPAELRSEYERGYKFGKFTVERRIESVKGLEEGNGMSENVEQMNDYQPE
mgnify:CR=1 FL=1